MKIRVYSTPTCGFCEQLKKYLTENHINFEVVDLAEHPEAASYVIELTGQAGVPVLVKEEDGAEPRYVAGFDVAKVNELLGIAA